MAFKKNFGEVEEDTNVGGAVAPVAPVVSKKIEKRVAPVDKLLETDDKEVVGGIPYPVWARIATWIYVKDLCPRSLKGKSLGRVGLIWVDGIGWLRVRFPLSLKPNVGRTVLVQVIVVQIPLAADKATEEKKYWYHASASLSTGFRLSSEERQDPRSLRPLVKFKKNERAEKIEQAREKAGASQAPKPEDAPKEEGTTGTVKPAFAPKPTATKKGLSKFIAQLPDTSWFGFPCENIKELLGHELAEGEEFRAIVQQRLHFLIFFPDVPGVNVEEVIKGGVTPVDYDAEYVNVAEGDHTVPRHFRDLLALTTTVFTNDDVDKALAVEKAKWDLTGQDLGDAAEELKAMAATWFRYLDEAAAKAKASAVQLAKDLKAAKAKGGTQQCWYAESKGFIRCNNDVDGLRYCREHGALVILLTLVKPDAPFSAILQLKAEMDAVVSASWKGRETQMASQQAAAAPAGTEGDVVQDELETPDQSEVPQRCLTRHTKTGRLCCFGVEADSEQCKGHGSVRMDGSTQSEEQSDAIQEVSEVDPSRVAQVEGVLPD